MPQKRKASRVYVENLQDAGDALSVDYQGKNQQKSTHPDSDISGRDEERKSGDEIVHPTLSKHAAVANDSTTSDGMRKSRTIMLLQRHLLLAPTPGTSGHGSTFWFPFANVNLS